jgi:hypothetical protein
VFTAMVLACAMGTASPETCIEALDELGPYATKQECYARVKEMAQTLALTIPVPMQFYFKCDKVKGVTL